MVCISVECVGVCIVYVRLEKFGVDCFLVLLVVVKV